MSKYTLNYVLDYIRSDVQDVLRNLSQDEINEMTPSDVCEKLDENSYDSPYVIYYADGWEIVTGSSFNEYEAEFLDFSNCKSSLDCIMQEARQKVFVAYHAKREEIATEELEKLQTEEQD